MAKIHQKLEKIFSYRILSDEEIPSYIKSLSEMGKLDEPKKIALFSLIFERLTLLEKMMIDYDDRIMTLEDKIDSLKSTIESQGVDKEKSKKPKETSSEK